MPSFVVQQITIYFDVYISILQEHAGKKYCTSPPLASIAFSPADGSTTATDLVFVRYWSQTVVGLDIISSVLLVTAVVPLPSAILFFFHPKMTRLMSLDNSSNFFLDFNKIPLTISGFISYSSCPERRKKNNFACCASSTRA